MSDEVEWIDWHPKAGDVRPAVYRWKMPSYQYWEQGLTPGSLITSWDVDSGQQFQITAPVATPTEDRPPWIDPQCKFRWGDRVKHRNGNVYFVIHPYDKDNQPFPVIVGKEPHAAVPYSTKQDLLANGMWETSAVDAVHGEHLELYPEDLPKHFDDRLLDADGPQEAGSLAQLLNDRFTEVWEKALAKHYGPRTPREIWVNEYPNERFGNIHPTYADAEENMDRESVRIVHFREVL